MNRVSVISVLLFLVMPVMAGDYKLDPTHSFVEWRVQHLGFSWLYGRFNTLDGELHWDADKPQSARVAVRIDVGSIDSNHAERDKHLRDEKYLDVKKHRLASFVSSAYRGDASGGELEGVFTLHGVSKTIRFTVEKLGEGKDPWGGYRVGFIARTSIDRRDYGVVADLGPMANIVELELGIEGIREIPVTGKR